MIFLSCPVSYWCPAVSYVIIIFSVTATSCHHAVTKRVEQRLDHDSEQDTKQTRELKYYVR